MKAAVSFQFKGHDYYRLLSDGENVVFGTHKKDTVQVPDSCDHMLMVSMNNGSVLLSGQGLIRCPRKEAPYNEVIVLERSPLAVLYLSRVTGRSGRKLSLPYEGTISVGRQEDNDVIVTFPIISRKHFQIQCESGHIYAEDLESTNHLYLNGVPIRRSQVRAGDVLSVFTCRFLLIGGDLCFENMGASLKLSGKARRKGVPGGTGSSGQDAEYRRERSESDSGFELTYHLSPRIREALPDEPIILSPAPAEMRSGSTRRGNAAYMIGSGAMMAASLATGMLTPAMLLTRMAGMVSPMANMAMYGKLSKEEKQQLEEYEKLRHEKYEAYMEGEKARIRKTADLQRRILSRENRSPQQCMDTVLKVRRNLWERMPSDSDFLLTRLGEGRQKLCVEVKSRAQAEGFQMEEDDQLQMMAERIIEETKYVDHMPVCIPLRTAQCVGMAGPREDLYYLLRAMLVEITSQHAASDVRLVAFFEPESRNRWGLLRWLPHIWDETGQTRYIAFSRKRVHLVCEMLGEVIRSRRPERESGVPVHKREEAPIPHYIVIIDNRDLIREEAVYESLIACDPSLGITAIFLAQDLYGLPQTAQYIIDLQESPCLYEREKYNERVAFTPDEPVHQLQLDAMCRKMSAVELETKAQKQIPVPQAVTFLEGYHVRTVEELDVMRRWQEAEPYQTLAAPLGVMEGGKIFSLDIRSGETSHGPHGLLAGTTGSGKSELLQSYILSMAVNYHPHDVNFVIIDYKGGGMSDLMEPLPHVVGKITNIDRNIGRSLVSLRSELRRRQKLFAQAGVNNIDKYQRAFKNGEVSTPLPHLILVTDEFAELKKEEPEFMAELNSVATIGRSLGVHMLLATQRPAGVVTDQINANSRFRICMKVQDAADSREMLGRPDAAKITQAGRAYIRVGEDEAFELFQSFYSGAAYAGADALRVSADEVSIVEETGGRISAKKKERKAGPDGADELTVVIQYIRKVCEENGIEKMAGPWLPELPRWLTLPAIGVDRAAFARNWGGRWKHLAIPVGEYDIPAAQSQGVQQMDFTEEGHYGVFGIPGSGKTMLLKTVLTVTGLMYSPADVRITVIDAGGWSLSEFRDMPHVAEVILNQEEEKIRTCIVRLMREMEARKRAFLKHAVNSLTAYRESVSDRLPAILLVIDQIGPLFEAYPEFEEFMNQVAANGAAYGVYSIFTANSTAGIRYRFLQLIKGNVAMQLPDRGEYGPIVGSVSGISLPQFAGRALMKGNPPVAFQAAVCDEAQEEPVRHEHLQALFREMKNTWGARHGAEMEDASREGRAETPGEGIHGKTGPEHSPFEENALPEQEYADRRILPVGTDRQNLDPVALNLAKYPRVLVTGTDKAQLHQYMQGMGRLLSGRQDNQVLRLEADDPEMVRQQLDQLICIAAERSERQKKQRQAPDSGEEAGSGGYLQICLLAEEITSLSARLTRAQQMGFRRLLTKTEGLGFVFIASERRDCLMRGDLDALSESMLTAPCMILLNGRVSDYLFCDFDPEADNTAAVLEKNELALVRDGKPVIVRADGTKAVGVQEQA